SERLRTAGFDEMRRIIREEEPPRPSTRVSTLGLAATTISANRRSDPRRLSQLFRGELDWIVMKALEKDRNRRYAWASAFAAAVQRSLQAERVQACPPSAWYRFRKFARRNRAALATTVVVVLAGLALLAGVLWHNARLAAKVQEVEVQQRQTQREAERAEANFDRTLQAVDKFLSRVGDARLQHVPGLEIVRRELLEDALQFFQGFLEEKGEEPSVRREAALAYRRMGDIYNMLGKQAEAEVAYRKALDLQEHLATDVPGAPDYRRDLAASHTNLGIMLEATRKTREAEQSYRRALDLRRQLAADFPTRPDSRRDLAAAHINLAVLLRLQGRSQDAEESYREAVSILEQLVVEFPRDPDYRFSLSIAHAGLGNVFHVRGRIREAEVACRQAVELQEGLAADY